MKEKEDIKLAFFLNLGFSLFELVGGLLTNSIAIFSDAIHDFGDSIAIGLSYLLENKSHQKIDDKFTYGYKRYSLMGAFLTSAILITGSIIVLFNALIRLVHPVEIKYAGMLIFAIFGIVINGYAAYRTSKSVNLNEKSVNLHMLEDVLGWIAVLIGALLIKITGWYIIDPLLSIFISVIIGFKAFRNVLHVVDVMLEKTPDTISVEEIIKKVNLLEHVVDAHHIHVWSLDGTENFLTMHVLVDSKVTKKNYTSIVGILKKEVEKFGIKHSTIEIEYEKCKEETCK